MPSIATNRYENHQQEARGMAVPYPQPASPTLTNPDMILPDYDGPDPYDSRPSTGPSLWNSGHHIEDGFQFGQEFHANPDPLSTRIIYGNGTMLSDIGEVTEVESVVGPVPSRNASKRSTHSSGDEGPFRASSLTTGKKFIQQRLQQQRHQHHRHGERRMSTESTSTVGTHDGGAFVDFDDAASHGGDSIFQGDDEESVASAYVEGTAVAHHLRPYDPMTVRRLSDDGAALSQRAEQILANAKARLTHMEDNLTRARTLSYSSVSDTSTPSPTTTRAPTSLRRSGITPSPTNLPKATRENGVAHGASSGTQHLSGYPQRSASALGSAGGYRRPLPTSRSMDGLGSASAQGAHGHFQYYQLDHSPETLGENGIAAGIDGKRNGSRTTTVASPTRGFSDLGLTRSASASQMRDLQYQLKGLKGKISSLKEQARADSMRRRSLQSLRMPSPFTNATWDPSQAESQGAHSSSDEYSYGNTDTSDSDHDRKQVEHVAEVIEEVEEEEEEEEEEVLVKEEEVGGEGEGELDEGVRVHHEYPQTPEPQEDYEDDPEESETPKGRALGSPLETSQQAATNGVRSPSPVESVATEYTEAESTPQSPRDGYGSESEESLYHEPVEGPISHEDREDVFDYEHSFLYSSIPAAGRHLRSESVSSASSAETARGPTLSHKRSASSDSTSSVDTFATANERIVSRSSTALSGYRVYTAADLFRDARHKHASSFRNSSADSDRTAAANQGGHQRSSTASMVRPVSNASIKSMHRPSNSSFDSVGTNRSFPLVNKAKLNGGILTPGGSPDQVSKRLRDSLLTDASSIYSQNSSNGRGGQSPALQVLSKDVQQTVERVVASLGKCVLALGEADGTHPGGHELYKRRIEAALRVLDGEVEIP
ncbi:hypothetical protein MKX07_006225 [Trichoderma sp. CBMAI-0711]|uniref:Uncharacterized protein n=1 Tax=Trichoderma parareesei TaxID=858221 RepID=A0A2H2ZRP4_TRIPA|nr:hypothetical protein MKX07_006225 [Trichoderma sp. CBMAI-0711]OTA08318.1 hypothetical protein A9Z42_0092620 [Trichoderma parareesei]